MGTVAEFAEETRKAAEAETIPFAEKPKDEKPGADGEGHNSKLTEGEQKALAFHHFRAIMAQKAKVDEQKEQYKKLRKLAKADGIVLADIDFMMRCASLDDDSIVPEELKRRMQIASWFALPVNFQLDMFATQDADRKPYEEGVAAGLAGGEPKPPELYEGNAGKRNKWMEGYHAGKEALEANLATAMEKLQREAAE
ncbi:MAG: hypothetical protein Kow0026_08530 [Oricola sp.]